jgi:dynein heavy chain
VLAEVTASATAAEKVKADVQKVKDKAQHIVDEINVEKSYAETKLEAAKPALMEAERALQVISLAL